MRNNFQRDNSVRGGSKAWRQCLPYTTTSLTINSYVVAIGKIIITKSYDNSPRVPRWNNGR